MPTDERLRTALFALLFLLAAVIADVAAGPADSRGQGNGQAQAAEIPPKTKTGASRETARFVSYWEGYAPRCDHSLDGFATIGYGHLLHYSPCTQSEQQMFWSRSKALDQLQADLDQADRDVRSLVDAELSPEMLSSLTSFTFNVGPVALRDSTLLRLLNRGHYRQAAGQFLRWIHGPGAEVLPGLIRRRQAERDLFLTGLG